jgi:hypothetical protein
MGVERMGAQQPRAEAVEGAHERGLGVARRLTLAQLEQARPDTRAQLPGGALGERDREDPSRRDAVLAHRPDEALDEHRRLAAARGRRDRERLGPTSDRLLLLDRQLAGARLGERDRRARIHPRQRLGLRRTRSARTHRSHRQIVGYMQPPLYAHVCGRA